MLKVIAVLVTIQSIVYCIPLSTQIQPAEIPISQVNNVAAPVIAENGIIEILEGAEAGYHHRPYYNPHYHYDDHHHHHHDDLHHHHYGDHHHHYDDHHLHYDDHHHHQHHDDYHHHHHYDDYHHHG